MGDKSPILAATFADEVAAFVVLEFAVAKKGEAVAAGLAIVSHILIVGLIAQQIASGVELELLLNVPLNLGETFQGVVVKAGVAFLEVLDQGQGALGVVAIITLDQGGLGLAVDHPVALQAAGRVVLELAEQAALLTGDFPTQGVALQAHELGVVPVDAVVLAKAVVVIVQYLAVRQGGFNSVADGIVCVSRGSVGWTLSQPRIGQWQTVDLLDESVFGFQNCWLIHHRANQFLSVYSLPHKRTADSEFAVPLKKKCSLTAAFSGTVTSRGF